MLMQVVFKEFDICTLKQFNLVVFASQIYNTMSAYGHQMEREYSAQSLSSRGGSGIHCLS